jgi:hypothetical protein
MKSVEITTLEVKNIKRKENLFSYYFIRNIFVVLVIGSYKEEAHIYEIQIEKILMCTIFCSISLVMVTKNIIGCC